jgi:opacity protein-like surface antigen
MQNRNFAVCAVLLAVLAGAALAADITGNWSGSMSMGDNQIPLSYTFKQDGEKLTGTVTGPQGDPLPLNNGKIQDDKLSFNVKVEGPNGSFTIQNEGTVKGEEITLTSKMEGGDFPGGGMPPMTLKRAK